MIIAQNEFFLITHLELPKFIFELSVANNIKDPRFAVDSNVDLPYQLSIDYNNLLCINSKGNVPCAEGIDVSGISDFNDLSKERQQFIERVCKEFIVTMKKILGPTQNPSSVPSPRPTTKPTSSPSTKPSSTPSTLPTPHPSMRPSLAPVIPTPITVSPTSAPSEKPSVTKLDVAIPFGFLNMYSLTASDIASNYMGTLGIVNDVFSQFSEEVESLLFTQTIGGRKLRSEAGERKLSVEFDDSWVTNLRDVGKCIFLFCIYYFLLLFPDNCF